MTGLLEALVLGVCINKMNGCPEATSAYSKQSPEYQQIAESVDKIGKRITQEHEWIVYVGSPIYSLVHRQPINIILYKGTTFVADPWNDSVGLKWSY